MKNSKLLYKFLKFILQILLVLVLLSCITVVTCRLRVKSTVPETTYYQGTLSEAQNYDYILVPGAGLRGVYPGPQLQDRLDTAIALYQNGSAPTIIISGAYNEGAKLHECKIMSMYLTKRGIPETDILWDEYGVDTAETLRRAKAFAPDAKFLVCTQGLYIERTTYLAKHFDLNIAVAESDILIYTTDTGKARLRETFAATKAVFEGNFCKSCSYNLQDYPYMLGGATNE